MVAQKLLVVVLVIMMMPDSEARLSFHHNSRRRYRPAIQRYTSRVRGHVDYVCALVPETGPCHESRPRYFYDVAAAHCRRFSYGGCYGNPNRYLSRTACERRCPVRDPCALASCENGGSCRYRYDYITCDCPPGYTGKTCQTDIDECASQPCQNGSTCTDLVDGYQCSCVSGFTGADCSQDLEECVSNPCMNGGACSTPSFDSFQCNCPSGFTGSTCETEINECDSQPCENGGTCVNVIDAFNCSCLPGYVGVNCEQNPCAGIPCVRGTRCVEVAECPPLVTLCSNYSINCILDTTLCPVSSVPVPSTYCTTAADCTGARATCMPLDAHGICCQS